MLHHQAFSTTQTIGISWDATNDGSQEQQQQLNAFTLFVDGLVGSTEGGGTTAPTATDDNDAVLAVSELSDFTLRSKYHRCFSVRRGVHCSTSCGAGGTPQDAPPAAVASPLPPAPAAFIRCVAATARDNASTVARHLSFCEAVVIAPISQEALNQALNEAWMAYFNSSGLRNRVVYVVVPPNCRRLQETAARSAVALMQRNFTSEIADRIGYPVLRVFAMCDFLAPGHPQGPNHPAAGSVCDSRQILRWCIQDIHGSRCPSPLAGTAATSTPFPYDIATAGSTPSDRTACRLYVVAKNTRERQLHVCVLGGLLSNGSRLLFPGSSSAANEADASSPSAAYLTVSHVERWGSALASAREGANNAAAKPATKAPGVGRPGDICTIDFRQLSKGFVWNHVPVDVVVGSGLLLASATRADDWRDGLFPKQPLAVALRTTPALARALALLAVAGNESDMPPPAPASSSGTQQQQRRPVCGGVAISFDNDTFFDATLTTAEATASTVSTFRLSPVEPMWVLSHVVSAATARATGGRRPSGPRVGVQRAQRLKRLHHARLPMCPVVARIVAYDGVTGEVSAEEYVDVVAVQGASYVLDAVVQCCAWLTKGRRALLDCVIGDLAVRRSVPLRYTAAPSTSSCCVDGSTLSSGAGTTRSSSSDPHGTPVGDGCIMVPLTADIAGHELIVPIPPYCSGAGVFAFLLNTFVVNNGQTLVEAVSTTEEEGLCTALAVASSAAAAAASGNSPSHRGGKQAPTPHAAAPTPLFVQWGTCLLPPLLCGLARMADSVVLKTLTPGLLDYVMICCDPDQLPVRTLAVVAPVVLHHIMQSMHHRMGAATVKTSNAPASTPDIKSEDSSLDVLKQTIAAKRFVNACHRRGVQFYQEHIQINSASTSSRNRVGSNAIFALLQKDVTSITHHLVSTGSTTVPLTVDFFRKLMQCDARFQLRDVSVVVRAPRHTGALGGWQPGPLLANGAFDTLKAMLQGQGALGTSIDMMAWSTQRFFVAEALLQCGPSRLVGSSVLLTLILGFL